MEGKTKTGLDQRNEMMFKTKTISNYLLLETESNINLQYF